MTHDDELVVRPWQRGDDLGPVRRFWYDVYVAEMGRHQDAANHKLRELDDARSQAGEIIVALRGERVVGTLICTPSWTGALGEYESLYDMARLGVIHPVSTAIITKLMVAPEYRRSTLSVRMSLELYRYAVPLGVHHPIVGCDEHLVPFFEHIGFRPWGSTVDHASSGRVHIMKLDCLDLEHLEHVRSPLLPIARNIAPRIFETLYPSPTEGVC